MHQRNGKDPAFTEVGKAKVQAIYDACRDFLDCRREDGIPAGQCLSAEELLPLDILEKVAQERDEWQRIREAQSSHEDKLMKEVERAQARLAEYRARLEFGHEQH